MVCRGSLYHFIFVKACLPQILLDPFLNTFDPYVMNLKHVSAIGRNWGAILDNLVSFQYCRKIIEA